MKMINCIIGLTACIFVQLEIKRKTVVNQYDSPKRLHGKFDSSTVNSF